MGSYQVTAQNFSSANDNKIHSDDIARRYGFEGALVPGVAVYGHMTWPLVERYGHDWLTNSNHSVRFFKPAYHDDELSIELSEAANGYQVECVNGRGVSLARITGTFDLPALDSASVKLLEGPPKLIDRPEMTWKSVIPAQPFPPWEWEITAEHNGTYVEQIRDTHKIYTDLAHPHAILSFANQALTREFVMPAWIHVGSEVRCRTHLNVGDRVRVRAVPLEKWRKKGHEFIRLYLACDRDGEITTEIYHTAIFRVAD